MKQIAKRVAEALFPNAFRGVGGCDPIILEPGVKFWHNGRKLFIDVHGAWFRWAGKEKCWLEV